MVKAMLDLTITQERIDTLMPAVRNARTHSKKQIRQIAESIRSFGFLNPILCDRDRRIVAGHGRWEAARLAGYQTVPVIYASDLSSDQLRAYALAENKLSELGGWSVEITALEFRELSDLDLGFDLTVTGFETAEIDLMLIGEPDEQAAEPAVPPVARDVPSVSNPGDVFQIGPHVVICGDALTADAYRHLPCPADMVFTDSPYNVRVSEISGLGRTQHPEFVMASGEMSKPAFTAFLRAAATQLVAHSRDGSIHFLCMDFRHMAELLAATEGVYSELKALCVWTKTNAGMGSLYRSQHELVFVLKAGTAPHVNNVQLGKHGRNRTNVWRYPGLNTFGENREAELAMHPSVKPLALVADAIMDCSHRGAIVLDAFLGSGTTIIAAHRTGRIGYGIELDPYYVDVALQRIAAELGEPARHVATGLTFEEMRGRVRDGGAK